MLLALPEKKREREHMVIKSLMVLCNFIVEIKAYYNGTSI